MDALQRWHINEAGCVTEEYDAIAAPAFGKRVEAAFRKCLRAPLEQLTALQILSEQWMQLHTLEELVHVECSVMIVPSNHKTDRDLVLTQRIHEASTKGVGGQGPSQSVDHSVERPLRLP